MINIALIAAETLVCFLLLLLLAKKYKTDGIYAFGILATFLACIMNLKSIEIMKISVPLGFGIITTIIIGANLITQNRGPDEVKNYIFLVEITAIFACCILNISRMISPSEYNYLANKSYDNIFASNMRMYIALMISLIIAIWLSSKLFYIIKKLKNKIILSNVFSMIITEFFENIIFVIIAYLFEIDGIDIVLCIIFRYTIKSIIGIIGTIPLYIANKYN